MKFNFSNSAVMRKCSAAITAKILTASVCFVNTANSGTLLAGQSVIMGSEGHSVSPTDRFSYHISLNAANPGFAAFMNCQIGSPNPADGKPFQVAITDTIQGYRFVNATARNVLNTVISNGVSITMTTTDSAFDSFNVNNSKIWTSTDPKSDLLKPEGKPDVNNVGIRDLSHVIGSIDISGLASGTVYFFYGSYNDTPSIIACMVDSDEKQPNISLENFHNGDRADRNERYMSSITFVNDGSYDSIEYDFAGGSLPNGTGRWDGIVVAGKPLP